MTERELAQVTARVIKATIAPLLADVKAMQAALNDVGAMRERIAVLEVRAPIQGPPGPVGPQGERGEKGEPGLMVKGDQGERGSDGKDADMALVQRTVEQLVMKAVAELPTPKDGRDGASVTVADVAPLVSSEVQKAVAAIPVPKDGRDGASVTVADVAPFVANEVQKAVAAIPVPKDGAKGADGKDGIGVMDAMLDRAGQLIVTLSNGQTKAVGLVVGTDGAKGADGRDVDLLFVQDFLTKELAKWPKPRDGQDGQKGADGLSPDDFDWDFNADTRELSITFMREGKVIAQRTKVLRGMRIYRKVYEAGRTYEEGDVVTWDGSEWTALTQTKERPGNGESGWKLTVKCGKEGKTGKEGKPGRDGRDLTNLGPDGRKWGP